MGRKDRLCNCPKCVTQNYPEGQLVAATTWRSHNMRRGQPYASKRMVLRLSSAPSANGSMYASDNHLVSTTNGRGNPPETILDDRAGKAACVREEQPLAHNDAICCETFTQGDSSPASQTDPWNSTNDLWEAEFYETDPDVGAGTTSDEVGEISPGPNDNSRPQDVLSEPQSSRSLSEEKSLLSAATFDVDEQGARPFTMSGYPLSTDQAQEGYPLPHSHQAPRQISDVATESTFRFDIPGPLPSPRDVFESTTEQSFWHPILLLVPYLNLRYHVPHRACNLILNTFRIILSRLGHVKDEDRSIATLRTAFNAIGLQEPFITLPMCRKCHRIYPDDSPPTLKCTNCSIPLFQTRSTLTGSFDGSISKTIDAISSPEVKCPFYPLSTQLPAFVCRYEKELEQSLKADNVPGSLRDIRDGKVWREAQALDGSPFFSPSDPSSLRIGLILHFDGFGGDRGRGSPSYSSGVLSFSVANLPAHLRYNPANLLLVAITPGPKELSCDDLQHMLEVVVDDILRLYREGITVRTAKYPKGCLCQVYCVADACDHPALCRVCSFADHSHLTRCCTRCKIPREDLVTGASFSKDYPRHTGDEHRTHARAYKSANLQQRELLFKTHGARYYALSRLPYFDAVRMSVVDPMHNVLLGLCKNQWLESWVNKGVLRERTNKKIRELDQIHQYLSTFEMPNWVGRLPGEVGYPAGGSLSADEYKALVLVYCPLIIPLIWREWQPAAVNDWQKAMKRWEKASQKSGAQSTPPPSLRMHPDDAKNFLKLAAALKILLGRTIQEEDLARGDRLLKEYLEGYAFIHADNVKPNHHWVTHIVEQVRDFGPVYGFWTFTPERLNKVLKSFSTNNRNGGEIETTFLRAFCRTTRLRQMIFDLSSSPSEYDGGLSQLAAILQSEDKDDRGTVASISSMVQEAELLARDATFGYNGVTVGPYSVKSLDDEVQDALLNFYQRTSPDAKVTHPANVEFDANHLVGRAKFHQYLIKDGRRIIPSSSVVRAPNSIVQTEHDGQLFAGQIVFILEHKQFGVQNPVLLAFIRWFLPAEDVRTDEWDPYPELEVKFWKYNDFIRGGRTGPPSLISPERIKSQAARATVMTRPPHVSDDDDRPEPRPVWVTIGLSREHVVI